MGTDIGEIDLGLNVNQSLFNRQIQGLAKSAQTPIVNAFKPIGKLIGGALAIGSIVKFTKSCLDLGSDLTEVQNVVDTTFKTMSGSVNAFAESAMMNYGMSETLAKQYIGTLGAMSNSMGFSEQAAYDMAASVTALTGDVASFYNLSTDEAFNKLKSIWTGETETLKSIGVLLTQTNLDQYALNNGFGKTTASMTEQEKVMLRYQYTMSALADASGDFAKTSGSWANQTRILSLQFDALKATLGQGFINLFTPLIQLINTLMAKLQALAQQFKAFTEMLSGDRGGGSSTAIAGAVQDTGALVSGLGGVTDAAKKAAKAVGLISVDELNVLPSAANASGGGGISGSAAADFGSINTAAEKTGGIVGEIDGKVSSLLKKIEPLTNALKRLWNGGLAKLGKFSATGLKDFYNNFLKPLGKWAFGTEDKGFTRLINIINEDLNGVDWDTINRNLRDFWKAIEPYAENFGEGLIDFFEVMSNVAFSVFELLFGEDGALVKMTGWLNNNDPEMARSWGFALGVLATSLFAYKKIKKSVKTLQSLFGWLSKTPLAAGASSAVSSLGTALSSLGAALTSLGGVKGLMTMDLATIFGAGTATEIGLTIGAGILGGIVAAFAGFEGGKALGKLIFPESADYYDNFSWFGDEGFFDTILHTDLPILGDALVDMIADIGSKLGGLFSGLWNGLTGLLSGIGDFVITKIWNPIDSFMSGIGEKVGGFFANIGTSVVSFFSGIAENIRSWFDNSVKPWFTLEKWQGIFSNIGASLSNVWSGIVDWWNNSALVKWWNDSVAPWFSLERWKNMLAVIPDAFTQAFKGAANGAIGFFNGMIGGVESLVNGAIKGLGNLLGFINKIPGVNINFDSWGISLPRIPMLAEGGYVGVNQPQLAVIGDNKRHGEIVAPENKMYEVTYKAMQDALRDILDNLQPQGGDSGGDIIIPVYMSGTKLDEFIVTAQDRRNFRNGGR